MPDPPNVHAVAVLALTVLALILFTRERVPLETSSLAVLAVLVTGFELFPYTGDDGAVHAEDFFLGFGHEALVAVCALMIVGHGLVRTGALEPVGRSLSRLWSVSPQLSLLLTLIIGSLLSAFVNNTPVVVLLLPILVSVSLRTRTASSGILMPMGLATLVGGMATTIGTSTNLLVVSVAEDAGLPRFGMFDFFVPAMIAGAVGILYLWLVAPRILPQRTAALTDISPRIFTAQLRVPEESALIGKSLAETLDLTSGQMQVLAIERDGDRAVALRPDLIIDAGDRLLVRDTPQQLKEFEQTLGAQLYSGDHVVDDEHPLQEENQQLAEIVVVQGSPLAERTLLQIAFAERHQLLPVALHRAGRLVGSLNRGLENTRLRIGDVLLVQGAEERIADLKQTGQVPVLDATTDLPHTHRAPLALLIMAGVIVAAAAGWLPIAISATCGVLLMLLTGCIDWRDLRNALSTAVVLIVVASLALGSALLETGASAYLAKLFLTLTSGASAPVVLSGLILLMAVLTNIVSNNAAAVIGTPIAIQIANELGASPEAFVLAVLFGANMSYATPMAYKTNLLVMNAGGYVFSDFVRVGVPLTVLMWLTLSWLLPRLYF